MRCRITASPFGSRRLAISNTPARSRCEAGHAGEIAVALGGDGLAGAVADALREVPGAILGVLPGGRGNDLARVLGIPLDPFAACAVIAYGHARPLDLGEVDGRAFVGIASAGFDSEANRIANAGTGAARATSSTPTARCARSPPGGRCDFEIELDPPGERVEFSGYTVAAANSRAYGGGMQIAPDASLEDGLLELS